MTEKSLVIGVDHGYAAMKTPHFSFSTGLVEYEFEPYTQENVLEVYEVLKKNQYGQYLKDVLDGKFQDGLY